MAPTSEADLAARIAEARTLGSALPEGVNLSIDEGYRVAELLYPCLGELAGWKVGATSVGGQSMLGISEPLFGRIPKAGVVVSPANLILPNERPCEAEPEIILEAGRDGKARRAWLGLEIVRPSRDDAFVLGPGFIVADNAAHVALVVGVEIPLELLDAPDSLAVVVSRNGRPCGQGTAGAVLGDPRRSLAWLAAKGLVSEGELVATGAMCPAARFAVGDAVKAEIRTLGAVEACWPQNKL